MTVHVLHAGDGYTYLTRQVASGDHKRPHGTSLADYYTAHGNPPGTWTGSGLAQLGIAGQVTEAQMRALFGRGLHPDADRLLPERTALYVSAGETRTRAAAAAERDVCLGRRFPTFTARTSDWTDLLAAGYRAEAQRLGLASPTELTEVDREAVRREVGLSTFTQAHGRDPRTESELRSWISAQAQPPRQPVAGYDLVFSPVKSVSVLWALADVETARQVEAAHHAAVARAMAFIEDHAALTRTGAGGVAQVDTHGLVVAAFDHRDSRTGDPNLHTHCAVSTKVRGRDGKWRSLDGRVLFALAVAASEAYNTAIEDELRTRLGVTFTDRGTPGRQSHLRPVREVAGIDPRLLHRFASRRTAIETEYRDRLAGYRRRWGHEPPRHVQMRLAQEATLATRGDKPAARSLAELRADWMAEARQALGVTSEDQVRASVRAAVRVPPAPVEPLDIGETARQVLETVQDHRATWTVWHLQAEAERRLRAMTVPSAAARADAVQRVVEAARDLSVRLTVPPAETAAPADLTRTDGESVFTVHGGDLFTSTAVLDAEARLVAAARRPARTPLGPADVDRVLATFAAVGSPLDPGQQEMARAFATRPRLLVAGIGPAGTGKTSAMRALVRAAEVAGARVIGLAPSARAAQVLADELGIRADTLQKLLHTLDTNPDAVDVRGGDVLLVDEAGMAGTLGLADLVDLAASRGAVVRLLGDPNQLAAIESGGALRLIDAEVGAVHLDVVHRFSDPAEAAATLRLRDGDPTGLEFYEARHRVHPGSADGVADAAYAAWRADHAEGQATVLLAGSTDRVRDLSARARVDRIADGIVDPSREVRLHDGTHAGVGDIVLTRRNDRRLTTARGRDWVKNGDLWRVAGVRDDGALDVVHARHRGRARLPAAYVAADLELGYAATIHRAQGLTAETAHVLVDDTTTRQALYTAVTRGRHANHLYVATSGTLAADVDRPPAPERDVREVLTGVLARDGAEKSATQTRRDERVAASSLARLVPEYLHAWALHAEATHQLRRVPVDVLGPDDGQAVLEDPAWPALARTLGTLADSGEDPRAALARAAAQRELVSADSPAQVLAWRLNGARAHAGAVGSSLPVGVPVPPRIGADPAMTQWLVQRAARISARIDHLAATARARPPGWLRHLGPRPAQDGDRWDEVLRGVVAYRDQHRVEDQDVPLGTRPREASRQQSSWDALTAEQRRLRRSAAAHPDDGRRAVRRAGVPTDRSSTLSA